MKLVFILFLLVTIFISYRIFTSMKLKITEKQRKNFFEMRSSEQINYASKRVLFDWKCRALLIIDLIIFIFTVHTILMEKVNIASILGLIIEIIFAKSIFRITT